MKYLFLITIFWRDLWFRKLIRKFILCKLTVEFYLRGENLNESDIRKSYKDFQLPHKIHKGYNRENEYDFFKRSKNLSLKPIDV